MEDILNSEVDYRGNDQVQRISDTKGTNGGLHIVNRRVRQLDSEKVQAGGKRGHNGGIRRVQVIYWGDHGAGRSSIYEIVNRRITLPTAHVEPKDQAPHRDDQAVKTAQVAPCDAEIQEGKRMGQSRRLYVL